MQDLQHVLELLKKLTTPALSPVASLYNLETTTQPSFVQTPPAIPKRKYRKRDSQKEEPKVEPPAARQRDYGDKPDPFDLARKKWIVKGPWKEGGRENPYNAIHIYSPDGKKSYKYVVGTTKAGYQGLTDDDVSKLKALSEGAHALAEAPKPPDPQPSGACQICLNRGRPIGKCEKMGSAHCYPCHSRSHGDMLYDWKSS